MASRTVERSIPTIDLTNPNEDETIQTLYEACTTIGFFYLEGHSLPPALMEEVFEQSRRLFALPSHVKSALRNTALNRGYTGYEEETLDGRNQRRGDTKEGYYIDEEIEETDLSKLKGPNVWPAPQSTEGIWDQRQCDDFRHVMESYRREASRVGRQLIRCLSLVVTAVMPSMRSAEQLSHVTSFVTSHVTSGDPNFFDGYFTDARATLRLLHYSAEESRPDKGVFACGAHSDYGMITLLLSDDNPGLQARLAPLGGADAGGDPPEAWIDIPPKRGAFVVNLGDMLERWTNGVFRSTVHRVLTPPARDGGDSTGAARSERYSIPFFFDPNFDALVKCLDVCCDDDNPPRYPPITAGQHLLNMYGETHADFHYSGEEKRQEKEQ